MTNIKCQKCRRWDVDVYNVIDGMGCLTQYCAKDIGPYTPVQRCPWCQYGHFDDEDDVCGSCQNTHWVLTSIPGMDYAVSGIDQAIESCPPHGRGEVTALLLPRITTIDAGAVDGGSVVPWVQLIPISETSGS